MRWHDTRWRVRSRLTRDPATRNRVEWASRTLWLTVVTAVFVAAVAGISVAAPWLYDLSRTARVLLCLLWLCCWGLATVAGLLWLSLTLTLLRGSKALGYALFSVLFAALLCFMATAPGTGLRFVGRTAHCDVLSVRNDGGDGRRHYRLRCPDDADVRVALDSRDDAAVAEGVRYSSGDAIPVADLDRGAHLWMWRTGLTAAGVVGVSLIAALVAGVVRVVRAAEGPRDD
ncbi:hypothetical protein [Streptomyces sp. NPDC003247]|uniref:hypothetical protein n=1 Tax=Streptomyces sp. NPDC003247 TaxID=3364677 RepID=UPI0036BB3669